eukprot:8208098-Alexandrium_andersonii.AAC.1
MQLARVDELPARAPQRGSRKASERFATTAPARSTPRRPASSGSAAGRRPRRGAWRPRLSMP